MGGWYGHVKSFSFPKHKYIVKGSKMLKYHNMANNTQMTESYIFSIITSNAKLYFIFLHL